MLREMVSEQIEQLTRAAWRSDEPCSDAGWTVWRPIKGSVRHLRIKWRSCDTSVLCHHQNEINECPYNIYIPQYQITSRIKWIKHFWVTWHLFCVCWTLFCLIDMFNHVDERVKVWMWLNIHICPITASNQRRCVTETKMEDESEERLWGRRH